MEAALFDMDGVLVDTQKYHVSIYQQIAKEEYNTILTEDIVIALGGVLKEEGAYIVAKALGIKPTKENCDKLYKIKNDRYKEIIREKKEELLNEGAVELLERLKSANVKMALCSASSNAKEIIKLTNIEHYFDAVVDLTKVKRGKPNPEIFLRGAIHLGVSPKDCVVYEDAKNGIKAAKDSGMYCVGYKTNLSYDSLSYGEVGADRVVNSLLDPLCYQGLYTSLYDNPKDCRVFAFDAGNVVINNIETIAQIIDDLNLTQKQADEFILEFNEYTAPLMDGNIKCEDFWKHLADTMNLKVEGEPFAKHFKPTLNQSMVTIIKTLRERGYRVVLASNTFAPHTKIMEEIGLFKLFDHTYLSNEINRYKPSPSFFRYIIQNENVEPSQIYFVDDLSDNIASAAKEGLKSLHYKNEDKNKRLKNAFNFLF